MIINYTVHSVFINSFMSSVLLNQNMFTTKSTNCLFISKKEMKSLPFLAQQNIMN